MSLLAPTGARRYRPAARASAVGVRARDLVRWVARTLGAQEATVRAWWGIAVVCTGCISESRRPVGDTRADVPEIIDCAGCAIADACEDPGKVNPLNPCEACVPSVATDRWSPIEAGGEGPFVCADDDPCTPDGSCSQGECLVPVAAPACGEPPSCVAAVGCDCSYTLVEGACLIEGVCYGTDDRAPGNGCLACRSGLDSFDWSFASGLCDDLDPCTDNDQCDQGQCAGVPKTCNDDRSCTIDFCDGGQCQHQLSTQTCLIDDVCYAPSAASPANPCMQCTPSSSQRQFTAAVGKDCDDDNRCTSVSACNADGLCVGAPDAIDDEPNDDLGTAQDVGVADALDGFPSGVVPANLVDGDRDVFRWGMTYTNLGLLFEPPVRVELEGATAIELCLYARCGQSSQVNIKPTVSCASQFDRAQLDDDTPGCCADIQAGEEATMILSATCTGSVVQGFAYASVQPKAGVDAATCGSYVLSWGATE